MDRYNFDRELKNHLQTICARAQYNIVMTQLEDTLKDGAIKPSDYTHKNIPNEPQSSWFPWWIFGW